MSRNLIVCCDGTGNKFGTSYTNVVKLCMCLAEDPMGQLLFYDPGVGTLPGDGARTRLKKWFTQVLDLAIANTLMRNVAEAYEFLANQYQPGDKIFIFGFSRGAYTARVIAAMIHMYGLLPAGNGNQIPYVLRMFGRARGEPQGSKAFAVAAEYKKTFARDVKIDFVGVWDTVSSVGWFWNPMMLPFTRTNPSVLCLRHAISIDERRSFFRSNVAEPDVKSHQDFDQVYFPGVHCDVGGGYDEKDSGLAQLALQWMLRHAEAKGLKFDEVKVARVLGGQAPFVAPNPAGMIHESLTGAWNICELIPSRRWDGQHSHWKWSCWKSRTIPTIHDDPPMFHWSVRERMKLKPEYKPCNLPARYAIRERTPAEKLPLPPAIDSATAAPIAEKTALNAALPPTVPK